MSSVESLVQPVDPQAPAGPNLEYDPEFLALLQLARGKPEQQFGEKVIPAQEPNWAEVLEGAQALLGRTKDLRVAVLWLRGAANTKGYDGFLDGLALIHALVSGYWDTVHPALDAEDHDDPTMRLNALAAMNDSSAVLQDVRRSALGGRRGADALRVRDIELALGKAEPGPDEVQPTLAGVQTALAKLIEADSALRDRLLGAEGQLLSIETLIAEKTGASAGINIDALRKLVSCVAQAMPEAAAESGAATEAGFTAAGPASRHGGAVRSREEALRALDQVCEWLQRSEPTNPAPLVIRRARRLMTMNFLDIVRDVAPSGIDQVLSLIGTDSGNA